MTLFIRNLDEHNILFDKLHSLNEVIEQSINLCSHVISHNGKIMFCGNGGSAADSQHLAAEFTGRFIKDRKPLPGLALTTDSSALTCIGNDYSFNDIFLRQIQALGNEGDCLVGISTSGNSENIARAFLEAKAIGIKTVGLLGRDGGKLLPLSDVAIVVPSDVTARIQEAHILIGHAICGGVEQALGLAS